ncbi:MAG: hypothetical protein J5694_00775 [Erysipelotrichaceae bacterium]|nr:hypothetical protein [Erysipelotrichaceae bacterium]
MLAMLLAAVLTGTAFAQAEITTTINWEDVSAMVEEAGISGDFYAVGDSGLCMWIPDVFSEVELTDEDVENGFMAYLTTEDESAVVSVVYAQIEDVNVDDYYTLVADIEGVEELEMDAINGIAAVSYEVSEQDSWTVSFVDDEGYVYEFTFAPMSDEGFQQVAAIMAASIQTVED